MCRIRLLRRLLADDHERLGALEKKQPEELRRAAHRLKSTALNFGAEALARHCRQVEKLARSGDLDAAREPAQDLAAEYVVVQRELEHLLDRYPDGAPTL